MDRAKREGRPLTTKDLQPGRGKDRDVRHGGARPNSSPKGKDGNGKGAPQVPWSTVRKFAESGATLDDIIKGTKSLRPEWLEDETIVDELKKVVDEGNATYRLRLRETIAKKALRGGEGSASTIALAARNDLGFDQQLGDLGAEAPDAASIDKKLDELLDKLEKKQRSTPPAQ